MSEFFDVRKSNKSLDQSSSLVAVIELSKGSLLVGGLVPRLHRQRRHSNRPASRSGAAFWSRASKKRTPAHPAP